MNTNQTIQLPVYNLDYELIKTYEDNMLREEQKKNFKQKPKKIKIKYVAITPDNKYVVCGYKSGHITIFDYETTEVIKSFQAHEKEVIHIEFYEPENLMFTCGADGKILIFDLNNFTFHSEIIMSPLRGILSEYKEIRFVLIDKGMEHIYFGSQNGCLYKCDKATNFKPFVYISPYDMHPSQPYFITSGVFSPDNKYLVFGSGYSLKFVNLATGKVEKMLGKTRHYINDIIFYPNDNNIVLTWSQDGTITYWNVKTEKELISFSASDESGYCHLAIDNKGQYLASANDGNYVNVWDAITKHHLVKIKHNVSMDELVVARKGKVRSLLFTKDNNLLTGSYDGTAKLWKLTRKE